MFIKGQHPWNKGLAVWEDRICLICSKSFRFKTKRSDKEYGRVGKYCSAQCMGQSYKVLTDVSNHNWKGEKAGYSALHRRVYRKLGKASRCDICGLNKVPEGKKTYFQWANKSREYNGRIDDWIQVCSKCHFKYDEQNKRKRDSWGKLL